MRTAVHEEAKQVAMRDGDPTLVRSTVTVLNCLNIWSLSSQAVSSLRSWTLSRRSRINVPSISFGNLTATTGKRNSWRYLVGKYGGLFKHTIVLM